MRLNSTNMSLNSTNRALSQSVSSSTAKKSLNTDLRLTPKVHKSLNKIKQPNAAIGKE